ncbi:hypothetical protein D3C85_1428420 [compost metagenome]
MTLQGHRDDFRRQAVAVLETVRHQIIDVGSPQQAQTQQADRAGRRTIGVEIANDQNPLALLQGRHQQVHRRLDAFELLVRDQARQALVQFGF